MYRLGNDAFAGCTNVQTATINMVDNGTRAAEIGTGVFRDCTKLNTVKLSGKAFPTDEMFYKCTSLMSVDLGSSQMVGRAAFHECPSLIQINIPSTCTQICNQAFSDCRRLEKLVINGGVEQFGTDAIAGTAISELDLGNTRLQKLEERLLGGNVKVVKLPVSINSLQKFSPNCFAGTQDLSVYISSFDQKYAFEHKDEFSNFGSNNDVTFITNDGQKMRLRNGQLVIGGGGGSGTYILTVGIQWSGNNLLKEMWKDCGRFVDKVNPAQQAIGNNATVVTLADGGPNNGRPDLNNVRNAIIEAGKANPELFIFHFSDHGSSGGAMCTYASYFSNSEFFDLISNNFHGRVFIFLCCCYPAKGYPDFIRADITNPPKVLVWAAGAKSQVTWMDPGTGHVFMTRLVSKVQQGSSWADNWNQMSPPFVTEEEVEVETKRKKKKKKIEYRIYTANPQKYNYNGFDESSPVFT